MRTRGLLGSLLAASIALPASTAEIEWQGIAIAYDAEAWRIRVPTDPGALAFVCIARDCAGEPGVYASARKAAAETPFCAAYGGDRPGGGRALPLADVVGQPPAIALSAIRRGSVCRALDTPILEACGEHAGIGYRFVTAIGGGCNHSPAMPENRFQTLLLGIRPASSPPK